MSQTTPYIDCDGYARQFLSDVSVTRTLRLRTLADLKRAIVTPGVVIIVLDHWQPRLRHTTRTPKTVRNNGKRGIQTNGYWFDGIDRNGNPCEMWADTPKASELRFNEDGSVTYYPGTERSWTLRFDVPK